MLDEPPAQLAPQRTQVVVQRFVDGESAMTHPGVGPHVTAMNQGVSNVPDRHDSNQFLQGIYIGPTIIMGSTLLLCTPGASAQNYVTPFLFCLRLDAIEPEIVESIEQAGR